jgi:hypothetical protein
MKDVARFRLRRVQGLGFRVLEANVSLRAILGSFVAMSQASLRGFIAYAMIGLLAIGMPNQTI